MATDLVVKDNRLIEASYSLGVVEQRLMLLAIVGAREVKQGIDAATLLTVTAEDYAKHFNVARQTAYQALQDSVETLFNRRATVEVYNQRTGRMLPMVVRWVTAMNYNETDASITIRFGPEVIPLISRLEEQFTSYELRQISGLSSGYAIRLYELLMQWKVKGKTPVFELEQFRKQLGVEPEQYQLLANFKRRVLELAVSQVNQCTDITVKCHQHKSGRSVVGYSFTFKTKQPPPTTLENRDENTPDMFTGKTNAELKGRRKTTT